MSDRHSLLPSTENPEQAKSATMEGRVSELRSSASLMRLDPGLYCILLAPSAAASAQTGLPGLRITHNPGTVGRPDSVDIATISPDGWMSGFGDAALVRVTNVPGFVLVTIYQDPNTSADSAPNLQILPLITGATGQPRPAALIDQSGGAPLPQPNPPAPRTPVDIIGHIQTRGDVGAIFGDWLGEPGSGKWIEGIGIAPSNGVDLSDIEYQVVLGRGWLSPWVEGGQFCGSRGMALPILGLRVRLRGAAAEMFELRYSASFIDGTQIGPVAAGAPCEAGELIPVEAIKIELAPIGGLAAKPVEGEAKSPRKTRKR